MNVDQRRAYVRPRLERAQEIQVEIEGFVTRAQELEKELNQILEEVESVREQPKAQD